LIFQQLGQLVRWSWGYHVLLAAPSAYTIEEGGTMEPEDGTDTPPFLDYAERYTDEPQPMSSATVSVDSESEWDEDIETGRRKKSTDPFKTPGFPEYEGLKSPTGERPPLTIGRPIVGMNRRNSANIRGHPDRLNSTQSNEAEIIHTKTFPARMDSVDEVYDAHPVYGESAGQSSTAVSGNVSDVSSPTGSTSEIPPRNGKLVHRNISKNLAQATKKLPTAPKWSKKSAGFVKRFFLGLWEFMNPPLWAMLAALLVASVPTLQELFFTPGTFVESSVTRAVKQSGNVAVPLILVVLGANLAGNTIPKSEVDPNLSAGHHKATARHERNILIAALVSRMVVPTIIVAPILALAAKFLPISLLDDPIFIIVCFLLAGAPSALQLSQICQLNGVYEDVMAKILFWSYVVVILPSTLILVICGLEVVEWATYDK